MSTRSFTLRFWRARCSPAERWSRMTVLITGGMGFIGTHTARQFLDSGEDVVVTHYRVQRVPDFISDELGKRLSVETIDVTSPHDVMEVARRHEVSGIVHLAVPGLNALRPA